MSAAINATCQVVRTAISASQVAISTHKALHSPREEDRFLHSWEAIAGAVAFFLNTTAMIGKSSEFSTKTLANLKSAEVVALTFKCVPTMTSTISSWMEGRIGIIKAIEQGLIAPTAGLVRVATECAIYSYRHLATLPDKDRYVEVPQGGMDSHSTVRVYLTVEECNAREAEAVRNLPIANIVDVAANSGLISTTLLGGVELYEALAGQLRSQQQPAAGQAINPDTDILSLDVANWSEVPECLAQDPILSRYTCAITLQPLRDPVIDPNGTTLYERSAILEALQRDARSPMTRRPLQPHELIDATDLKILIDHRLSNYQNLLKNAVQQGHLSIVPGNLQQSVDAAHPNY